MVYTKRIFYTSALAIANGIDIVSVRAISIVAGNMLWIQVVAQYFRFQSNLMLCMVFTIAFLWAADSPAETPLPTQQDEQFKVWLAEFVEEATREGVSRNTLYQSFKDVELLPRVIELDRSQPYKTKTFDDYLQTIVPDYRVADARQRYQEHRKLLDEIGKKYGVQPRFIVALWAVESNFGRNMGGFNIINALTTLAYDGRRSAFFRKELLNALKIIDQGHTDHLHMKGSWAGAMGQTQFMPSSFLELAVDYDGDGRRDIWGTHSDVFGSIANYLSKRGWDENTTWGREVRLPKNFDTSLIGKDIEKTLQQWHKLNVRKADGGILPQRADLKASLIRPEDNKNKTYLVYSNYKTILKWNRSLYFATAVGILADGIGN